MILVLAASLGLVGPAGAQTSLNELLTPYLGRYHLPALAAAVVQDGKVVASGAVGTRRARCTRGRQATHGGNFFQQFILLIFLVIIFSERLFSR